MILPMKNKIWYELVDIKYGEFYLTVYIGLQRRLKKSFNILTLLISVSGILGWKFFENYAWIAFILIAIMQLFTLIENHLIRSDNEIEQISELKMLYTRYFNKLECLWEEYKNDRITENRSSELFFEYRKNDWEKIQELDAKLDIKSWKWLMRQADKETNNYLNKYQL